MEFILRLQTQIKKSHTKYDELIFQPQKNLRDILTNKRTINNIVIVKITIGNFNSKVCYIYTVIYIKVMCVAITLN